MFSDKNTVNLLWTGGWDSTYRICELVLLKKIMVRPIYLIDHSRISFPVEIKTMHRIKSLLIKKNPGNKDLILPIFFMAVEDLTRDAALAEIYQNLKKKFNLGGQYEWIANFIKQFNVLRTEISVHRCEAHDPFPLECKDCNEINEEAGGKNFEIKEKLSDSDFLLFKGMRFPLMKITKREMRSVAIKENFLDVMDLTWFCHKPTLRMEPCGVCNPCVLAIEEGMGYRVPLLSLIRSHGKRVQRKILKSKSGVMLFLIFCFKKIKGLILDSRKWQE